MESISFGTSIPRQQSLINSGLQVQQNFVRKGDEILKSTPYVYILKEAFRGLHCDHCLRKKKGMQRCSGCALCYYCSKECQRKAWVIHKKECCNLRKVKPRFPPDTARLMARIIFRIKEEGDGYEENIDSKRLRKFKDLLSHCDDIKNDPKRQEHFVSLVVVLRSFVGEENLLNTNELLEIYGRVFVNSFTITDKDLSPVGIGIYLAASIFDHSCKPNCYASFNGLDLTVRSLYDHPECDFQKLRICYLDVLTTREDRLRQLKEGYFFTCMCPLCQDSSRDEIMFSISCGNPSCGHHIAMKTRSDRSEIEPCPECGFSDFEPRTTQKYLEVVQLTKEKLDEIKNSNEKDTANIVEYLLEKQGGFLHKLNLWRVLTLNAAFDSAIRRNQLDAASAFGCENLDGLRFYYGPNHPLYGLTLLKLGKMELHLFKLEAAYNHLREAEPIFEISHGRDNPIYSEDLAPLLKQATQEIGMMQFNGFKVLTNS